MQESIVERLQRIERQINLIRNQKVKAVDSLGTLDDRLEQLQLEFNELSNLLSLPGAAPRLERNSTPAIAQPTLGPNTPPDEPLLLPSQPEANQTIENDAELPLRMPAGFMRQTQQEAEAHESILGTRWLSRIGIVALLFGITMALAYSFPHFSNELKIFTGFVVAGLLYGAGHWVYKQTAVLGRILQGGGLSVGYGSLFAVFFIPQVQLIDLPMLGVASLFCYVAGMLWMAHRLNSQTVAILSTAFGYYTAPYAGTQEIQLISAGILSLATVFVTRLHPDWQALPKINWAGAIITYLSASFHAKLPNSAYQGYLIYTGLLFHLVSLLRGTQGDFLLGQINTFAFYLLFLGRTPDLRPHGLLELAIAAVQLASLWLLKKLDRETDCRELAQGLVINTLLLTGIAICRYFGTGMKSVVLAAEALALASMAAKSKYKNTLVCFAYASLLWAYIYLTYDWKTLSHTALFANALWVASVTLWMEYGPFRKHTEGSGLVLIIFAQILLLSAILEVADENLRSVAISLQGFAMLTAGFIARRKIYRMTGLALLFGFGGMSILVDMIRLETIYKILLFIFLGVGLLGGSYGYSRLSRHIAQTEASDPAKAFNPED